MDHTAKPTRNRRWIRWLALPATAVLLAAVYQLTRPPELVWWASPPIGKTRLHVRALIPSGWKMESPRPATRFAYHVSLNYYDFSPADRRPRFIRWMFPQSPEDAEVRIDVSQFRSTITAPGLLGPAAVKCETNGPKRLAYRVVIVSDPRVRAGIVYERSNPRAFQDTYEKICNSLRVE